MSADNGDKSIGVGPPQLLAGRELPQQREPIPYALDIHVDIVINVITSQATPHTPQPQSIPPRPLPASIHRRVSPVWIVIGGCLLLLAASLAVWGFVLGDLTPDQRNLLHWALPLASGFAVGCFSGGLRFSGPVGSAVTTATGGFAVWLLMYYFPPPIEPHPLTLSITTLEFLDEDAIDGNDSASSTEIKQRKDGVKYVMRRAYAKVAIAFVVEGFIVRDGQKTNLATAVHIKDALNVKSFHVEPIANYDDIYSWENRPSIQKLGKEQVLKFLHIKDRVAKKLALPYVVVFSKKLPAGTADLYIEIKDQFAPGTQAMATKTQRITLINPAYH